MSPPVARAAAPLSATSPSFPLPRLVHRRRGPRTPPAVGASDGGAAERGRLLRACGVGRCSRPPGRRHVERDAATAGDRAGARRLAAGTRLGRADLGPRPCRPSVVRVLLEEMRDRGVSVLLNSHLLSEIELVCDRVAILRAGEVVAAGSPAELSQPRGVELETNEGIRTIQGGRHAGRRPQLVAEAVAAGRRVYGMHIPTASTLEDPRLRGRGGRSLVSVVLTIMGYGFQKAVRRKVFAVVILLTAAFLALFWLATHYVFSRLSTITPPADVQVDAHLAGAFLLGLAMFATLFLGVVLAVFLTLGVVSGDAERGLLQPLVRDPSAGRPAVLSRFLGAAVVCVVRAGRVRDCPGAIIEGVFRELDAPVSASAGARVGRGRGSSDRRLRSARLGLPLLDGEWDRGLHAARSRPSRRSARHDRTRAELDDDRARVHRRSMGTAVRGALPGWAPTDLEQRESNSRGSCSNSGRSVGRTSTVGDPRLVCGLPLRCARASRVLVPAPRSLVRPRPRVVHYPATSALFAASVRPPLSRWRWARNERRHRLAAHLLPLRRPSASSTRGSTSSRGSWAAGRAEAGATELPVRMRHARRLLCRLDACRDRRTACGCVEERQRVDPEPEHRDAERLRAAPTSPGRRGATSRRPNRRRRGSARRSKISQDVRRIREAAMDAPDAACGEDADAGCPRRGERHRPSSRRRLPGRPKPRGRAAPP